MDETTWSDPIYFDMLGIDQDVSNCSTSGNGLTFQLFWDDDGKVYLCAARWASYERQQGVGLVTFGAEVDLATGRCLTTQVKLRESDQPNLIAEGPHIFKRHGWYYLFVAEGGTDMGHQEWVMRARHPLGPYDLPEAGVNPIIFNDHHPEVQQTGHMDFTSMPDGSWAGVVLGIRPQRGGTAHLGRETFLVPVKWEGEWPEVNGGKPVTTTVEGFSGVTQVINPLWRDNFSSGE